MWKDRKITSKEMDLTKKERYRTFMEKQKVLGRVHCGGGPSGEPDGPTQSRRNHDGVRDTRDTLVTETERP